MHRFLLTTALATTLATGAAWAQTTPQPSVGTEMSSTAMADFEVPEGFVRAEDIALTVEQLMDATVYDAAGEAIGDIEDLVLQASLEDGAMPATTPRTTPQATGGDMASGSDMTDDDTTVPPVAESGSTASGGMAVQPDTDVAADADADSTMRPEGSSDMAADTDADSTMRPEGSAEIAAESDASTTPPVGAEVDTDVAIDTDADTDSDEPRASDLAAGDATDPMTTDPAAGSASGSAASTDMATNEVQPTDGSTDATGRAVPGADVAQSMPRDTGMAGHDSASDTAEARVTHAVIEVGGFLGIGEHAVAVPVEDLVVYRNEDALRVYLPWTEEQLEAMPEFDRDDPSTLSGMTTSSDL